jgi:hypothetical protein
MAFGLLRGESTMSDGYYVDLGALRKAADGVTETINAMATKKVSDIDAPKAAFGHDGLAHVVQDFCDRWEIGVEHLTKDGDEIAARLNFCVLNYERAEKTVLLSVEGILRSLTGPDPAAS